MVNGNLITNYGAMLMAVERLASLGALCPAENERQANLKAYETLKAAEEKVMLLNLNEQALIPLVDWYHLYQATTFTDYDEAIPASLHYLALLFEALGKGKALNPELAKSQLESLTLLYSVQADRVELKAIEKRFAELARYPGDVSGSPEAQKLGQRRAELLAKIARANSQGK
jgi:hypothetical protein